MAELDRNLEEVTQLALKTGDKIVTVECPCCNKIFYATESEAAFVVINRNEQTDFGADLTKISGKKLGRKCPFCGFSGSIGASDLLSIDRNFIKTEIAAEEKAEEIRENNRTPWSEVNNMGVFDK